MKGATTEPFASTSSPPSSTLTNMIGSIQNFRRAPRKRHICVTNSIVVWLLEHVAETVVGRPGRGAAFPVARALRLEAPLHGVAAEGAHRDPDRRENDEENQPHHHRADHVVHQLAELHPGALERRE